MRRPRQRRYQTNQLLVENRRPPVQGVGIAVVLTVTAVGLGFMLALMPGEDSGFAGWMTPTRATGIGIPRSPGGTPVLLAGGPRLKPVKTINPASVGLDDPINGPSNPPMSRAAPVVKEGDPAVQDYLPESEGLPDKHKQLPDDPDDVIRGTDLGLAKADEDAAAIAKDRAFIRYLRWVALAESERDRVRDEQLSQPGSGSAAPDPKRLTERMERLERMVTSIKPPVPPQCLMLDGYVHRAMEQERRTVTAAARALKAGDAEELGSIRRTMAAGVDSTVLRANLEIERLCRQHKMRSALRLSGSQAGPAGAVLAIRPGAIPSSVPPVRVARITKPVANRPVFPARGVKDATPGKSDPKSPNPAAGSAVIRGGETQGGASIPAGSENGQGR